MTAYRKIGVFALVLLAHGLTSTSAFAQLMPSTIRNADPADRSAIVNFATPFVSKLKNQASEKAARDWFLIQVTGTPSPSFLNVYSGVINDLLLPLAADKDMRLRLNVAVINAEVAHKAGGIAQAELTSLLMNDKSDPVTLWGIKAAKYILPSQLSAQPILRKPNLLPAILPIVKNHAKAGGEGPIVEEAYLALTLGSIESFATIPAGVIKEAAPEVLRLFEYRASQYAGGAPPAMPLAENLATLFLTRSKVWSLQPAAQQARTMKDIYSLLIGVQGVWAGAAGPSRIELSDLVRQNGRVFQVIADLKGPGAADLRKAAQAVTEIGADTDAGEVMTRLEALKAAIDAVAP